MKITRAKTSYCYRRTSKELFSLVSQKKIVGLNDYQMNHWESSLRFCFVLEAEANFRKGYIQIWCDHGCCVRVCRLWLKQTSCPGQSGEGLISILFSTGSCALNTGLLLYRKKYLIYLFLIHIKVPVCVWPMNGQYKVGIERHIIDLKYVCIQMNSNSWGRKHLFWYGYYWTRLI